MAEPTKYRHFIYGCIFYAGFLFAVQFDPDTIAPACICAFAAGRFFLAFINQEDFREDPTNV